MRVRVLYFAGARDVRGVSEEERELPPNVRTVADFARHIGEEFPELAARMSVIRIAKNERFAEPTELVADGDTLALIPPVAGG